jgi:hypothetical protein
MLRGGGASGYFSPEGFRNVMRGVWFTPSRFFGRLDPDGGPLRPALFATSVLYLNLILNELLQEVWLGEFNFGLLYAATLGFLAALVLAPLLVAGLTMLVLTILDGTPSRRKFGPVFRALGYTSAILIVLWIPFAPFLAIPYSLYVATIAMKEVLFISPLRAAASTLVPLGAVLLIFLLLLGLDGSYELLTNPPGN